MENFCVICGDIIPEGRTVCPNCEHAILKIGALLQSQNTSKENAEMAYESAKYRNIISTKQND